MFWNIPSDCVKWSDEPVTFWALRLWELDWSSETVQVIPFLSDGQIEAQGHPKTLWRRRFDPGSPDFLLCCRMNVHAFARPRGTLDKGAMAMDENHQPARPDVHCHLSFDISCFLCTNFFRIYIQWVDCIQICAFGLMRLELRQIKKNFYVC